MDLHVVAAGGAPAPAPSPSPSPFGGATGGGISHAVAAAALYSVQWLLSRR